MEMCHLKYPKLLGVDFADQNNLGLFIIMINW